MDFYYVSEQILIMALKPFHEAPGSPQDIVLKSRICSALETQYLKVSDLKRDRRCDNEFNSIFQKRVVRSEV